MDFRMNAIKIKPSEYTKLARLIYEVSGIHLGDNKQELLKTRIGKRLRLIGLRSYKEYYDLVADPANSEERMMMINAISTNFTSFFREKQHFDILRQKVLPEIKKDGEIKRKKRLRAWCAAASSGEEPYSIALTLMEFFGPHAGWDIKILATDISTKVLNEAIRGEYPLAKVKPVGPVMMSKYFTQQYSKEGAIYRVADKVKDIVVFRRLNLMDRYFPFSGLFEFIMCRNVMIYFDQRSQEDVTFKLLRHLVPGGYLFIGHSENIPPALRKRVDIVAPAAYRKVD